MYNMVKRGRSKEIPTETLVSIRKSNYNISEQYIIHLRFNIFTIFYKMIKLQ